jgi:hypothetical protein
MNDELKAIADALDKSTGDGRDREAAVALADAYVAAHPELFAGLEHFSLPVLVNLLADHRNAGREEDQWNVETWLLHHYPPQNIGGEYTAEVRLPNS